MGYFFTLGIDLLLLLLYNGEEVINMDFKSRRTELKMTQEQVAKAVGVSLMSYQLWERGATTPKEENLIKLQDVLGVGEIDAELCK